VALLRPQPLALLLLCSLAGSAACTNAYPQQPGEYALSATEEIVDDCGLLATPEALWDAELLIAGDTVRMDFGLFEEQQGSGGIELVGFFLGVDDRFTVDGSVANVTTQARGQQCLLDSATVHLDGRTDCPSQFSGTLRVRFESRRSTGCNCELWVKYVGAQPRSSCAPAS
jgi:hypothetical protein